MGYKEDYFNAVTILSIITIESDNFHEKIIINLLGITSFINHIIPDKYRNNNIIKPILSKLILKNEPISEIIKNIIIVFDTIPLLSYNLKYIEYIGSVIRQFVIFKNQLKMPLDVLGVSILCKLIYTYERTHRIKLNERKDFGILHNAEHVELYLYIVNNFPNNITKSKRNILIYTFFTGFIIPSIAFKLYNVYIINTYKENLPRWFDKKILNIINKKIMKNYQANIFKQPQKYFTKIYGHKLSWEIQTWNKIERQLKNISIKIKNDGFNPDLCVGVKTGGSLCVKYLSKLLECSDYCYIDCKTWSGNTLKRDLTHVIDYSLDKYEYLKAVENCNVSELSVFPENVERILLFDDSVVTGKTMYAVCDYLRKKYPKSVIKTCTLIINNINNEYFHVDYYNSVDNIPIFWPWGCELD
jgi:hypoxanthine phosphoribosyltransferase